MFKTPEGLRTSTNLESQLMVENGGRDDPTASVDSFGLKCMEINSRNGPEIVSSFHPIWGLSPPSIYRREIRRFMIIPLIKTVSWLTKNMDANFL